MQFEEDDPDVPGSADILEVDRALAEDLREARRQRGRHDIPGGNDGGAGLSAEGGQLQPQQGRHRVDLHSDGLRQQRTGRLHRVHRLLPRRHHQQERTLPKDIVQQAGCR